MDNFIHKKRKKAVILLIITIMLLTGIPIFSLATDTKVPEITVNVKSARINRNKTVLSFTITDDSPLRTIYYKWDNNIVESQTQRKQLSGTTTTEVFTMPIPADKKGLHEFSIAAEDNQGNISNWLDIPYYIVETDQEAYADGTIPEFITKAPEYPYSGSHIKVGTSLTINMVDESDIYWIGYKWVTQKD